MADSIVLLAKHKGRSNPLTSGGSRHPKGICWKCGGKWFHGHVCSPGSGGKNVRKPSTASHKNKNVTSNAPEPPKPVGGTLLYLLELEELLHDTMDTVEPTASGCVLANTLDAAGFKHYYINSGAGSHYVTELLN